MLSSPYVINILYWRSKELLLLLLLETIKPPELSLEALSSDVKMSEDLLPLSLLLLENIKPFLVCWFGEGEYEFI